MIDFNNACIEINRVTIGLTGDKCYKSFQQMPKLFNIYSIEINKALNILQQSSYLTKM